MNQKELLEPADAMMVMADPNWCRKNTKKVIMVLVLISPIIASALYLNWITDAKDQVWMILIFYFIMSGIFIFLFYNQKIWHIIIENNGAVSVNFSRHNAYLKPKNQAFFILERDRKGKKWHLKEIGRRRPRAVIPWGAFPKLDMMMKEFLDQHGDPGGTGLARVVPGQPVKMLVYQQDEAKDIVLKNLQELIRQKIFDFDYRPLESKAAIFSGPKVIISSDGCNFTTIRKYLEKLANDNKIPLWPKSKKRQGQITIIIKQDKYQFYFEIDPNQDRILCKLIPGNELTESSGS